MEQHEASDLGRLGIAMAAVAALLVAEVVVALLSRSLALLGDAGHLLTDSASLGLAAWAVWRSRAPAGPRHTYGHHRKGILVAAVNGLALLVVAAALAAAAIDRFAHPAPVEGGPVVAMAAVAIVVNVVLALLLGEAGGELSVRSALLHVLSDAVAATGVLVSGVIILTTGWLGADPAVSLLIACLIAAGAVRLLHEASHILGEGTPRDVDPGAVTATIVAVRGVEGVHDLHIWSLDRRHRALSAHILVEDRPLAEITALLRAVEERLCSEHAIEHATLQPECPSCAADASLYCNLDERHVLAHEVPVPDQPAR